MPGRVGGRTLYPGRRANVAEETNLAFRPAGVADLAPVLDQQMREHRPAVARKEPDQVPFDLYRINLPRECQPLRDTAHVRVHDDAFVFSKGIAEDDVGLVPKEACRLDDLFDIFLLRGAERGGRSIALEQRRRHQVDALVGALRAEDRRDEELEGRLEVERAVGAWIVRGEPVVDLGGALGGWGGGAALLLRGRSRHRAPEW